MVNPGAQKGKNIIAPRLPRSYWKMIVFGNKQSQ
jgi:hypothetical protein